jgi:hypothetical protein
MKRTTALPAKELAEQIDQEHEAACRDAKSAIDHAIACGKLLLRVRSGMKHGEWLTWVEANTKVSARQCQRYVKAAKNDNMSRLLIDGMKLLAPPQPAVPELEKLEARLARLDSRRSELIQRIGQLRGAV